MEKSQALIRQIKDVKQKKKIPYQDIIDELTENGVPKISMTTLRRVCADGSEAKASSFSYEGTLIPIAEAIKRIGNEPDDIVKLLKSQIDEKDELINRLIDRLDQKDEIIRQLLTDMKQKDFIINNLLEIQK